MTRHTTQEQLALNGKWLAQPASGTQRYATEVVKKLAQASDSASVVLIVPSDATIPEWAGQFTIRRSRLRGQLFEQVALPWLSRRRHLYSLAGPAPLLKRNQTVVMHDAMPFRFPGTFRLAFVAWYWLMYGLLSRTAGRVVTVSTFSRGELSTILRVPADRFELAPCGADHLADVDSADEQPDGATHAEALDTQAFALIVGNLAPHKNVMPVARALAGAGIAVTVVGGGQQVFREVEQAAERNLRHVGRVSDAELAAMYASAAVLVAPSFYEGFCIPIVEAGMRGCPSVFAAGSAMREVAGSGGVEFDPGYPEQCVDIVASLLQDHRRLSDLGEAAKENSHRFGWQATADAIFGLGRTSNTDHDKNADHAAVRKVTVLHVTETFSAGTGTAIVEYAHAVRSQGVESHLLAQDRGSNLLSEINDSPFESAQIIAPGPLQLWKSLRQAIATIEPDVVHFHSSIAGVIGRLTVSPFADVPVVYSPHCFAFERRDVTRPRLRAIKVAESVLARNTNAFVCVSPHEADLARRLRPGVDVACVLNSFSGARALSMSSVAGGSRDDSSSPHSVVTVGRIAPQKNPGMFRGIIDAFDADEAVEATWVGDGDPHERELLEKSGVDVTGWLDSEGVAAAVSVHALYLHTADWEASVPIAVLDAMHAGLPVVVRRNAAYRELLPEEWQFDDIDQAVTIISELRDPLIAKRRVEAQFELIAEYAKSGPAAVLSNFYRGLCDRSSNEVLK